MIEFKKEVFEKVDFEKKTAGDNKTGKIPGGLFVYMLFFIYFCHLFFFFFFFVFCCCCFVFSKSTFLKKYFRNTISVKQFGSRSKRRAGSESELFDSLVVFPKEFCKKMPGGKKHEN